MNRIMYKKHIPVKRFGQNFLKNDIIIKKIIQSMNLNNFDNVIEIGPGLGALTFPICEIIDKITVLEIDENIIFFLLCHKYNKKMNIILTDVMKFDFRYFFSLKKDVFYRLVGNLPYNISICFFLKMILYNLHIYDMHFMFQEEVAYRLLANPGHKKYGKLSVMAQFFYRITPITPVDKFDFFPKPKINSIFLRFVPYNHKYDDYSIEKYFFALELITRTAFQHRRKLLKSNLSNIFSEKLLLKLNIHSFFRAENVSVYQYSLLVKNFLKSYT
ncbi:16S rRNA (adenine(1518)-N(6)/adenine(1519)-N(6))-dimethyltransferase RsmA [Buchnera aphidicola]|uniref:Ribosomal RNA small subunit methyltransferase A n=1 Tax=Buchnera aphidicola (Cinara cf. splendens/pseudotsugae 3390) TaxID=2518980 RepID=A0A451CWE8_9GAMM|nr:16S rRNA (adenine(1518)-N(6)/adenine(1519)-N(6))-dimethyltransferase RsmA [Buchnera aphidicola]VFP77665.1 Ribosomal RNA small subunit methyltransferase A [Buchnera aphidicola (Cinara cf. splendens/pseudotsugae 3390)]